MTLYAGAGTIEPVTAILDYRRVDGINGAVVELAPIDGAPAMTTWVPLADLTVAGGAA